MLELNGSQLSFIWRPFSRKINDISQSISVDDEGDVWACREESAYTLKVILVSGQHAEKVGWTDTNHHENK